MLCFVRIVIVFLKILLTAASERGQEINVVVVWSHRPHELLHSQEFVPFSFVVIFVAEKDLLSVECHTMASKELHEQDVLASVLAQSTDFLELGFPLLDRWLVERDLIEITNALLLLCVQAVVV